MGVSFYNSSDRVTIPAGRIELPRSKRYHNRN